MYIPVEARRVTSNTVDEIVLDFRGPRGGRLNCIHLTRDQAKKLIEDLGRRLCE